MANLQTGGMMASVKTTLRQVDVTRTCTASRAENAQVKTKVTAKRRFRRGESGQAAVETALVMPLFLFCMMGFFQIMLMHQARLVTKYAAYKAVRTGALQRNNVPMMTQSALAVVAPMTLLAANGRMGNVTRFDQMSSNKYDGGPEVVKVTICGPTRDMSTRNQKLGSSLDFDEPADTNGAAAGANPDYGNRAATADNWQGFESNKLSVQVLYNYRMFIPFVNGLLFHLVRAEERVGIMENTRIGTRYTGAQKQKGEATTDVNGLERTVRSADYGDGGGGNYFMPIRASYVMRMHSNLRQDDLPTKSDCVIPFKKKG